MSRCFRDDTISGRLFVVTVRTVFFYCSPKPVFLSLPLKVNKKSKIISTVTTHPVRCRLEPFSSLLGTLRLGRSRVPSGFLLSRPRTRKSVDGDHDGTPLVLSSSRFFFVLGSNKIQWNNRLSRWSGQTPPFGVIHLSHKWTF